MSECPLLEIQDRLPDFVLEQLDARMAAAVVDHLRECAACRADVAVIRSARGIGVRVPAIDTERIMAAVVEAGRGSAEPVARPPLRVVPGGDASGGRVAGSPTRSLWRRTGAWQRAAVLMLCVTGAVMTVTSRGWKPRSPDAVAHQTGQASTMGAESGRGSGTGSGAASSVASGAVATVSYGDLADYSEGELETMLATLEEWDGAPRAEPETFEPVLSPVRGNVP